MYIYSNPMGNYVRGATETKTKSAIADTTTLKRQRCFWLLTTGLLTLFLGTEAGAESDGTETWIDLRDVRDDSEQRIGEVPLTQQIHLGNNVTIMVVQPAPGALNKQMKNKLFITMTTAGFIAAAGSAKAQTYIDWTGLDPAQVTSTGQTFNWTADSGDTGTVDVVRTLGIYSEPGVSGGGIGFKDTGDGTQSSFTTGYSFTFSSAVDLRVLNTESLNNSETTTYLTDGSAWTLIVDDANVVSSGFGTDTVTNTGVGGGVYGFETVESLGVTEFEWTHSGPFFSGENIQLWITSEAVPEPSSALLLGISAVGVLLRRRRR